jgi:hypothetical protein
MRCAIQSGLRQHLPPDEEIDGAEDFMALPPGDTKAIPLPAPPKGEAISAQGTKRTS